MDAVADIRLSLRMLAVSKRQIAWKCRPAVSTPANMLAPRKNALRRIIGIDRRILFPYPRIIQHHVRAAFG
jgi:hypothetical protein